MNRFTDLCPTTHSHDQFFSMPAYLTHQDQNPNSSLRRTQYPVKDTSEHALQLSFRMQRPTAPCLGSPHTSAPAHHERSLSCRTWHRRATREVLQGTQLSRAGRDRNSGRQLHSPCHSSSFPAPPPIPVHRQPLRSQGADCPGPGPLREGQGSLTPPASYRKSRTWQTATFQAR